MATAGSDMQGNRGTQGTLAPPPNSVRVVQFERGGWRFSLDWNSLNDRNWIYPIWADMRFFGMVAKLAGAFNPPATPILPPNPPKILFTALSHRGEKPKCYNIKAFSWGCFLAFNNFHNVHQSTWKGARHDRMGNGTRRRPISPQPNSWIRPWATALRFISFWGTMPASPESSVCYRPRESDLRLHCNLDQRVERRLVHANPPSVSEELWNLPSPIGSSSILEGLTHSFVRQ